MAQFRTHHWLHNAGLFGKKTSRFFVWSKRQLHQLGRSMAYWSTVALAGFTITGIILHVGGVDIVPAAHASEWVPTIFGSIMYWFIIAPIGYIGSILASILEVIIQYPWGPFWIELTEGDTPELAANQLGFVNVESVVVGWRLVRDVCNLFFSVILLIIAMSTALKIEAYSWKQLLPKFVLMAILINFSKTIAGVFTDVCTVAMATFGGSFSDSFGKAIYAAFGMNNITSAAKLAGEQAASGTPPSGVEFYAAMVAAAAMTVVFTGIVFVYIVTLIMRILMLWLLIVLSPIAYITRILPNTKSYSSEWWKMFSNYCLIGPLITFFLWLSLTIAFGVGGTVTGSSSDTTAVQTATPISAGFDELEAGTSTTAAPKALLSATSTPTIGNFVIATLLLLGSLNLIHRTTSEISQVVGKASQVGFAIPKLASALVGVAASRTLGGIGGLTQKAGRGTADLVGGKPGDYIRSGSQYLASVLRVAGGTVAQPIRSVKRLSEGIQKSLEGRQKEFDNQTLKAAEWLQNSGGFSRRLGGGQLIGDLGRAALGDVDTITNMTSPTIYMNWAERGVRFFGQRGRVAANDRVDQNRSIKGAVDKVEQIDKARESYNGMQAGLTNDDAQFNINAGGNLESLIQDQINLLKNKLNDPNLSTSDKAQIDVNLKALDASLDGEKMTVGVLANAATMAGSNLRPDDIKKALIQDSATSKERADTLGAELEQREGEKFFYNPNSLSYVVRQNSDLRPHVSDDGRQWSKEKSEKLQNQINQDNKIVQVANQKMARIAKPLDVSYLQSAGEGMAEEEKRLRFITDAEQLRDEFSASMRTNNLAAAQAILYRAANSGNAHFMLNDWYGQYLQTNGVQSRKENPNVPEGQAIEDRARSDHKGFQDFGKTIFEDYFGMSNSAASSLMNGIAGLAAEKGNTGATASYRYVNGGLNASSDDFHDMLIDIISKSQNIAKIVNNGDLGMAVRQGGPVYGGNKLEGWSRKLIIQRASDLADDKYWRQLPVSLKEAMAEAVRGELKDLKNPNLTKLERKLKSEGFIK